MLNYLHKIWGSWKWVGLSLGRVACLIENCEMDEINIDKMDLIQPNFKCKWGFGIQCEVYFKLHFAVAAVVGP